MFEISFRVRIEIHLEEYDTMIIGILIIIVVFVVSIFNIALFYKMLVEEQRNFNMRSQKYERIRKQKYSRRQWSKYCQ